MAKKNDTKAARERKQKIFLAVGGVVLLALAVIQGPKLLDRSGGAEAQPAASSSTSSTASPTATTETAAAPAAAAPTGTSTPAATATTAAPVETLRAPRSARAQLAGVVIVPEQPVKAGQGQLQSFTLFVSKDPFVQQVGRERLLTPAEVAKLGTQPASDAKGSSEGSTPPNESGAAESGSSETGGSSGGSTESASAPTIAILKVNGVPQTIQLGKRFPRGDGSFQIKSLKPGRAGIAVAGGEFAGGGVLTLRLGRQITLVNTATGARYVVKLLYVGDESQVTRFSSK